MKMLLRNHVHGSDQVLTCTLDPSGKPRSFKKASSTPVGVQLLLNENQGWDWYLKNTGYHQIHKNFVQLSQYAALETDLIEGHKVDFNRGLIKNQKPITQALEHYIKVWKKSHSDLDHCAIHGDLSLDNILFTSHGPVFMDWEHFQPAALPLGFDALYLIYECAWFEFGHNAPSPAAIALIQTYWRLLQDQSGLSHHFQMQPLARVLNLMRERSDLWGTQMKTYPAKFPILKWSEERVRQLDAQLTL